MRMHCHFARILVWCTILCFPVAALAASGSGKPFALIVPSDARLEAQGGVTLVPFGYYISTSPTLTTDDFAAASISSTITGGSGFAASLEPLNAFTIAPLSPGQVGGVQNAVQSALLLPG